MHPRFSNFPLWCVFSYLSSSSSRELYFVVTGMNVYQVTIEAFCSDPELLSFKQTRIHSVQMFVFSPLMKIFHFRTIIYDRCSWKNPLIADEVEKVLTFLVSQGWNWARYTYVSLSRNRIFILYSASRKFFPRSSHPQSPILYVLFMIKKSQVTAND